MEDAAGQVLGWLLGLLLILALIGGAVGSVIKSGQQMQGKNRCKFCRAKLQFTGPVRSSPGVRSGYADTCKKCGRVQPWSTQGGAA